MGWVDEIRAAVQECASIALDRAWPEWLEFCERHVQSLFNESIDDFYNSYSPKYKRRGTLYELLFIDIQGESFSVQYDEDNLYFSHGGGGEDYLYDLLFEGGYHGGADDGEDHPSPGTPYWRAGRRFSRWGRPAKQTASPKATFDSLVDNFDRNIAQKEFEILIRQYLTEELERAGIS